VITLKNLQKTYKSGDKEVIALQKINLEISSGEIFGVIGRSGAGKSTLLRCVNLLERPSQGQVVVDGQELTALSASQLRQARRNMGMIFQHFNLLSSKTAYQNISLPLEIMGLAKEEIHRKILPLIKLTGLKGKLHHYSNQLSGGQKQRVAIARALANDCKVLLCDEATSALDPETTASILELLKKVRSELGVTILLITHEMDVIKKICDRVAVIDDGDIVELGETMEIFSNPKQAITKTFVHSNIQKDLPAHFMQHVISEAKLGFNPVLRLWFLKGTAAEPLISYIVKRFHIDISIVHANLELVHNAPIGIMMVTLRGYTEKLPKVIDYLNDKNVKVEVLGYVPNNLDAAVTSDG
jgi:D-methionine transport system ATP-binding protein